MKDVITIEDLMVPLDEYATVPEDVTLYEAVKTLEKTGEVLHRKRCSYLNRAVLVLDRNRKPEGIGL